MIFWEGGVGMRVVGEGKREEWVEEGSGADMTR